MWRAKLREKSEIKSNLEVSALKNCFSQMEQNKEVLVLVSGESRNNFGHVEF